MKRRFLATNFQQRDYVDLAGIGMQSEPEALTAEEHTLHIDPDSKRAAEQQQAFEEAQRERKWRMMSFDQALADVQIEAVAKRIDISSDMWTIRQMERAGKKIKHMERRLGAIRRKVYR